VRLRPLVQHAFDQRAFESEICKQQSIGDLKLVKDKLQEAREILDADIALLIHQHLPLFLQTLNDVLRGFETSGEQSQHYKALGRLNEA
jgi:hypothetical protein